MQPGDPTAGDGRDETAAPPPPDAGEPELDSTRVLPVIPAETEPPATFSERSDAQTQQLPGYSPPAAGTEQPRYDQAEYGQPTYAQPAQPTHVYGQPAQPTHEQPAYGQSPYQQPSYQQPDYQPTAYTQPEYQQPAYPPAGYQQPGYQQPSYQQPGYQQPGYQQPGYQQSSYQQPGYAQAPSGYGTTEAAAPVGNTEAAAGGKRSHKGLWSLLVVVVVIAAAIIAIFAIKPSPLFKKVLDHTAVEQTIQQQSANGTGDYTSVSCPANEKAKSGTTFECTASGGKKITVRITNSKGDYVWTPSS
jgi:hypothetical protein